MDLGFEVLDIGHLVTNELTNVQMKKKWMNVKLITYLGNSH
jgi:hypothetical protein